MTFAAMWWRRSFTLSGCCVKPQASAARAYPCHTVTGVLGESGSGHSCRASAILARAQRRDVRPNIWASRRSDSGLPACTLSRYAATDASLPALAPKHLIVTLPAGRDGRLSGGLIREPPHGV